MTAAGGSPTVRDLMVLIWGMSDYMSSVFSAARLHPLAGDADHVLHAVFVGSDTEVCDAKGPVPAGFLVNVGESVADHGVTLVEVPVAHGVAVDIIGDECLGHA